MLTSGAFYDSFRCREESCWCLNERKYCHISARVKKKVKSENNKFLDESTHSKSLRGTELIYPFLTIPPAVFIFLKYWSNTQEQPGSSSLVVRWARFASELKADQWRCVLVGVIVLILVVSLPVPPPLLPPPPPPVQATGNECGNNRNDTITSNSMQMWQTLHPLHSINHRASKSALWSSCVNASE